MRYQVILTFCVILQINYTLNAFQAKITEIIDQALLRPQKDLNNENKTEWASLSSFLGEFLAMSLSLLKVIGRCCGCNALIPIH